MGYGLKQAGRAWYQALTSFLTNSGFSRSKNDYYLFTRTDADVTTCVLVWADDIIIGSKNRQRETNELRINFSERFKMDDRSSHWCFLGMSTNFGDGFKSISQTQYIDECPSRVGLKGCKAVSNPPDSNYNLAETKTIVAPLLNYTKGLK